MEYPEDLRYTQEHEWVRLEGDNLARIGISEFAQDSLGDVVYVELPDVGDSVKAGKPFGVVESVKAASDLYSPVSGIVAEVNARLEDEPEMVNDDPYGEGWMVVVELDDPGEVDALMDAEAYARATAEES
jgi:glycine cleavage system H protein